MSSQPRKVAIILHGPPAIGKSQIWEVIVQRHSGAVRLSLDDGWCPGEHRYAGGPGRYADLAQCDSDILVVELGWGEPSDVASHGATQAAREWVDVLQSSGREIYPFLLWAQPAEMWQRVIDRQRRRSQPINHAIYEMGIYCLYEHRNPLFSFPTIPNFSEREIDTTGQSFVEVANTIMQRSDIR